MRVLAPGPELAEHPSAMTVAQHDHTAAAASEKAATAVGSALRWPRREDLLHLGYYLLVAFVLAYAGYPAWRIAVLAVPAVVPRVTYYFFSRAPGARRHDPKRCVNADPEMVAWWVVLSQAMLFATTGLAAAILAGSEDH